MKTLNRLFSLFLILAIPSFAGAQNEFDLLRYSANYYEGTARTMALGNAFTALGGDLGALPINPAASAIYRSSEFQITPSLTYSIDKMNYLNNDVTERRARLGISSVGVINNYNTGNRRGFISWSLAFAANRVNNYNTRSYATGVEDKTSWLSSMSEQLTGVLNSDLESSSGYNPYHNSDLPWSSILAWDTYLIDPYPGSNYSYVGATENIEGTKIYVGGPLRQRFRSETTGSNTDYTANFGANISNKLFFGVNFTIQSLSYDLWESYSESANNIDNFETGFQEFTHTYDLSVSGMGFNMKAGVIFLPFSGLRLGLSLSTPTWFSIDETWQENMSSSFMDGVYSSRSPLGQNNWKMTTPMRINAGAAYVIGNTAILSVDYENVDYTTMKRTDNRYSEVVEETNSEVTQKFKVAHNLRAGLEVKPTPLFAVRLGYNYYDSAELDYDGQRHYGSLGFGFKTNNGFFMDIAYQRRINYTTDTFTLYQDYGTYPNLIYAPLLTSNTSDWKLLFTIGFKF